MSAQRETTKKEGVVKLVEFKSPALYATAGRERKPKLRSVKFEEAQSILF